MERAADKPEDVLLLSLIILLPWIGLPALILLVRHASRFLKHRVVKSGTERLVDFESRGEKPAYLRLKLWMLSTKIGRMWLLFQVVLSQTAVILLIYDFYQDQTSEFELWHLSFEIIYSVLFAVDYGMRFYGAQDRLRFVFGLWNSTDLASILPVFVTLFVPQNATSLIAAVLRTYRSLRSVRVLRARTAVTFLRLQNDRVRMKVLQITYSFLCMIIIFSCMVFAIDVNFSPDRKVAQWHIALYSVTAATTTVIFGDIAPGSDVQRLFDAGMVVVMWAVMSLNLAELIVLVQNGRDFRSNLDLRGRRSHIVIGGVVTYDSLQRMLREVFDRSRTGSVEHDVCVVVVLPTLPSRELVSLTENPQLEHRLMLSVGSLLFEDDLERIRVREAEAIFLFTDKAATDVAAVDMSVVLQALAVVDYAPALCDRVYVQVIRSSAKHHLKLAGIHNVVPIEGLKHSVIGRSGAAPGLTTLLAHLLTSYSPTLLPPGFKRAADISGWRREYLHGAWQQLRAQSLSSYAGHHVGHVTAGIFLANGATLFALETQVRNRRRIIVKPDTRRMVRNDDVGYFIVLGSEVDITHGGSHVKDLIIARGFDEFESEKARFTGRKSFKSKRMAAFDAPIGSANSKESESDFLNDSFAKLDLESELESDSDADDADDADGAEYDEDRDEPAVDSDDEDAALVSAASSAARRSVEIHEPVYDVGLGDETEESLEDRAPSLVDASGPSRRAQSTTAFHVRRIDNTANGSHNNASHQTGRSDDESDAAAPAAESPGSLFVLIVVCGALTDEVSRVIDGLRQSNVNSIPIVILTSRQPRAEIWRLVLERVRQHRDIKFVFADPLDYLASGAVGDAKYVLVLQGARQALASAIPDADVIVFGRAVTSMYPSMFVLVELVEARNLEVVCSGRRVSERALSAAATTIDLSTLPNSYFFNPRYAAGYIFADSIFDTLLGQMFLNSCARAIIKLLTSTGNRAQIFLIDCPPSLVRNDETHAFLYLLVRGYLMIGVYRHANFQAAPLPFVFANAPPATVLYAGDRIYVIADRAPSGPI
jgi:voltage-gated potassium channel